MDVLRIFALLNLLRLCNKRICQRSRLVKNFHWLGFEQRVKSMSHEYNKSLLSSVCLTHSMNHELPSLMTPITGTVVNFPINPITKHFRITRQVASAGPEMVWKIFDAVRTDTNELCSVFLFEKCIADKLHKPRRREIVTNMLKKEVNLLTQLNHPNLLHVVYPVVETSENIAFASEHVMLSLANYFGNHTRMPQPLPEDVQNFQLDELDRKMGLYQLTDALRFLHSGQSLFHNNVCPSAILLTLRKQWRLSSLAFVEACQDDNSLRSNGKISMEKTIRTHGIQKHNLVSSPWSRKLPKMARPDSRYAAPECLALTTSWAKSLISRHCRPTPEGREVEYEGPDEHPVPKITKSKAKTRVDGVYTNLKSESPGTWSDMFSLGLLICSMYTTGQPSSNSCFRVTYEHEASLPTGLHDSVQQTTSERGVLTEDHSEMLSKDKNAEIRHAKQLADDETLPSAFRTAVTRMPLELVDPVEKMLSRETHRRPTSQLFSLLKFFNDPALICLDVMLNFENKTQEDRLKGLQSIVTNLDMLSKEIIYEKLVPLLLECYEKLKYAEPTPAVSDSNSSSLDVLRKIICVFAAIVEYSTPRNYEKYMEVPLVKLLGSSRDIYSKTEILRQVSHLTKHASAQVIEQLMVPIVCSCLESQITDTKIVAIESLKEMSSYFQQTELDTLVLKRLINSYGRWSDQFRLNFTIITSLRPMVRQLSIRAIQEQLIPFLVECCKSVSADAMTVNGSDLTDVVEQPAPLICSVWKDVISTRANSLDSQVITRQIFPSILPHILNQTLSVTEFRIIMSTLYALLDTLDVPTAGSQTSMDNAQYYLIPAVTVNTPNDTCTSRRASGISIGQRDSDKCEINSGTRRKTVRAAVPFVPMLHPKQLQEMEQSPNLPRRASAHVILPLPQSFDSAESITGRASDRSVPSKSIFNLSSPLNLPLPSFSGQRRHSSDAPRERTSQQVPILHIQSNQHSLSRVSSENTMSNLQHSLAVSKRQSRMLESPEINLLTARVCEGPFISAPSIGMSSRRSSSTRIAETVNDLNMIRQNVANQSRPQLTGGLGDVPSARKSSLYALGDAVKSLLTNTK